MANKQTVAEKEEITNDKEEVVTDFNPPLDVPNTTDELPVVDEDEDESIEEEPEKVVVTGGSKVSVKPEEKVPEKELVEVRCPGCPWKPGLVDENTYCPSCNGTGKVQAEPLE